MNTASRPVLTTLRTTAPFGAASADSRVGSLLEPYGWGPITELELP